MSTPCSASHRCWRALNRSGTRRARQYPKSSSAASRKRQNTLASGATLPSWNVIAIQVLPQIATQAVKRGTDPGSRTCLVLGPSPVLMRQPHLVQYEAVGERELVQRVVAPRGAAVPGFHDRLEEHRAVVGLQR